MTQRRLPHVVLASTYDAVGNRTAVQDNSGVAVQATYDARNLLASQTWSGGGIAVAQVAYHYDTAGQRTEMDRFGNASGTALVGRSLFNYDAAGRLLDGHFTSP